MQNFQKKKKSRRQLDQCFSNFNVGGRFIALMGLTFVPLSMHILWQSFLLDSVIWHRSFFGQNDSIKIDANKRHLNVSSLSIFFDVYHYISITEFQRMRHHVKQGGLLDFWFVRLGGTNRQHLSNKETEGRTFCR